MSDVEKISDKAKFPMDRREGVKKDVDPTKFRRYVDKVQETDPEEQKRRRLPGESDDEYAQRVPESQHQTERKRTGLDESQKSPDYSKKTTGAKSKDRTFESKESSSKKGIEDTKGTKPINEEKKEEILSPLEIASLKKEKLGKKVTIPQPQKPVPKTATKEIPKEKHPLPQIQTPKVAKEPVQKAKTPPLAQPQKPVPKTPTITTTPVTKKEEEIVPPPIAAPVRKATKETKKEKAIPTEAIFSQVTPTSEKKVTPTPQSTYTPAIKNPEMLRLFSHMVTQITMVVQRGETNITITLGGQAFQNSVFNGSQIVLKESPLAPRQYNIELYGATNEAQNLFDNHASELLSVFQNKQYPFTVKRITTSKTKKHMIERKKEQDHGGLSE